MRIRVAIRGAVQGVGFRWYLPAHPTSAEACRIGMVTDQRGTRVLIKTAIGAQRILDMASGEQLPRIC